MSLLFETLDLMLCNNMDMILIKPRNDLGSQGDRTQTCLSGQNIDRAWGILELFGKGGLPRKRYDNLWIKTLWL